MTALAYPDATDYLDIPAATYDLEVCASGTDTCPVDLDPVAVEAGTSYSAFAVGSLTGDTLGVVIAVDSMTAPSTDTVGAVAPSSSGSSTPALAGLVALAALAFVLALRRLSHRIDQ